MIFDISDENFRKIFDDMSFHLPIRWDGKDFSKTLNALYDRYIDKIQWICHGDDVKDIKRDCDLIIKAVNHYLNGFPNKAYNSMDKLMSRMISSPVGGYFQTALDEFDQEQSNRIHPMYLFRATAVSDNQPYQRDRIFHTPYNMRSKVSTHRYGIAGFPSLYLGTSLELCCEEIHLNPHKGFSIAARFEPDLWCKAKDRPISFVDLAIKPQDLTRNFRNDNNVTGRIVDRAKLADPSLKAAYLSWYPLVAACSYIRVNKEEPFAAEYIIPQLLMQWARSEMQDTRTRKGQLIGIRYFSCSSVHASDMGFNYVFPTSGEQREDKPYCPVLTDVFSLTMPHYIHEYPNIQCCQEALISDCNVKHI